ncbi:MAG: hypothetical protein GF308_21255, partial [Candidatus Heimdallarchaeota archaeon]|nr:hypothetical protein [Candidatus Heimdallarchaeota archaeon]
MIINKVSVYNWMAHEDTTVDISGGKNLLFGRNAIGKSSLAKAIAYNLTGKKSDKYDPRRTTEKEAMVELTLTTKEDKQYLIRRQISQGKRGDESLFIYKADNPSEALFTGNNAEQFLNDMIGISFDVFERVIYMKEEDVHSFLANPSNAVLKEIDRLIGLEKATTIINSLQSLNDFLRGEKRAIVRQRRDREKGIRVKLGAKTSTREVKKIEKELDEIERYTGELLELKALIEKRDGFASQLEEKKEELEVEEIDKLEAKILVQQAAKKEELSKFKEKEEQKRQNYAQLREHHSKIKAKEDLNQTIISDLKEQLEEGTISECPTCRREMDQELAEEVIGNLEQQIKKLKREIQEKLQKINALKKELDQNSKLIRETEQKIQRLNEMKSEVEVLLKRYYDNKNAIEQFDDDKKYPKTISVIENKLDELDDQSKELTRELGKAEGAEEVTEEKIEELKEEENNIKHK